MTRRSVFLVALGVVFAVQVDHAQPDGFDARIDSAPSCVKETRRLIVSVG